MSSTVTSTDKLAHTRAHPPPLLVQPPLGYTTYYTGITLGSMRWAAWWVAFYRGCPSVLWCAKGKRRWQVNGDILPVVELWFLKKKLFDRTIQKMRSNAGARMQALEFSSERSDWEPDGKDQEMRRAIFRWLFVVALSITDINLSAVGGLRTHSLFSVDWPVWETLEYNLLVLTCSLKKALSTGIRL